MSDPTHQVKPTRKTALSTDVAVLATAVVVLPYLASQFGILEDLATTIFILALMIAAPVAIFRSAFVEREPPPVEGRRLVFSDGILRQFDDDDEIAGIDSSRDFQYRVLDRYDTKRAVFRLYQGDTELTLLVSDPGGEAAVKDVVQIRWPPRNRHAGRSYPPTSV